MKAQEVIAFFGSKSGFTKRFTGMVAHNNYSSNQNMTLHNELEYIVCSFDQILNTRGANPLS